MKTVPAHIEAQRQAGSATLAHGLRITRKDGMVYGFTSAVEGAFIDGVYYDAAQGLDVSEIVWTSGLGVDNLELTTLDDGSLFSRTEVFGGIWQNAAFLIFEYDYTQPSAGIDPLTAGVIGNITLSDGKITVELRGLQQYLQQPVGIVSSKTCRARLGDQACRVDLTGYTFQSEVSAVTSRAVFQSSDLASQESTEDYFGEGLLTFTSGSCQGITQKVREYTSAGGITLSIAMPANIQIGDTFEIVAGCRKRREDCRDKFSNVLNFQGEPDILGVDALTAPPDESV
jgi:uncharacterized phage protein (TIGR02218 family)